MIRHDDPTVPKLTGRLLVSFFKDAPQADKDRLFLEAGVRVVGHNTEHTTYRVEPIHPIESLTLSEFSQIAMKLFSGVHVCKVSKVTLI